MDRIATIDGNHIVALFTPDEAALRDAASADMKSVVNFRASDEKGGLSLEDERRVAEAAGLNYLHHPVTQETLSADLTTSGARWAICRSPCFCTAVRENAPGR